MSMNFEWKRIAWNAHRITDDITMASICIEKGGEWNKHITQCKQDVIHSTYSERSNWIDLIGLSGSTKAPSSLQKALDKNNNKQKWPFACVFEWNTKVLQKRRKLTSNTSSTASTAFVDDTYVYAKSGCFIPTITAYPNAAWKWMGVGFVLFCYRRRCFGIVVWAFVGLFGFTRYADRIITIQLIFEMETWNELRCL